MSELKQLLRIAPITNKSAGKILDNHPLGVGRSFSFALGIFWADKIEGVMTWGGPISSSAVYRYGLRQCESLELRKFWVSNVPTGNSESRSLAVAVKMIAKRYPQIRLLLTYCEEDEKAAAYKGAGWVPQASNRYMREVVTADGITRSVRDVNRFGGTKVLAPGWKGLYVARRKWVYVLDKSLASVVQSSTPAHQAGDGGSHPTRTLKSPDQTAEAIDSTSPDSSGE